MRNQSCLGHPSDPSDLLAYREFETNISVGEELQSGWIVAMAPNGIRIQSAAPCRLWEPVQLHIQNRNQQFRSTVSGVVHWCEKIEDHWELGVWLDREVPDQIVSCCWQDMRRELRYDVNWCAVAQWPNKDCRAIQITSYSRSGMTLICTGPFRQSADEFLIRRSFDSDVACARGTACWSSQLTDNEFMVGCRLPPGNGFHLATAFSKANPKQAPLKFDNELSLSSPLIANVGRYPDYQDSCRSRNAE